MRHTTRMVSVALATVLLGAGSASSALAGDKAAANGKGAANKVRVVRDKDTGQLRGPTKRELRELLEAERRAGKNVAVSGADYTMHEGANGMKAAILGESFLITLEATRDEDGNLVTSHSDPALDGATSTTLPTE